MVSEGIIRKMDSLGRIVIPKEMRKVLNLKVGEEVSIANVNNNIVIRKYAKGCVFCGNEEELIEYRGTCVCKKCRESLNK